MVKYIYTRTVDCGGNLKNTAIPYCGECNKVVDKCFMFCPYCGEKLYGKEDAYDDGNSGCEDRV